MCDELRQQAVGVLEWLGVVELDERPPSQKRRQFRAESSVTFCERGILVEGYEPRRTFLSE